MNNIHIFWNWFVSRCDYIYDNLETDTDNIALEVTEHLKAINIDLEFEISFDFEGVFRELIISADGLIDLFDIVTEIVSYAPNFAHWKITAFRQRLHQRNQRIDLEGISMDYNDIFFRCKVLTEGIQIEVYLAQFDGVDNRYVHLYFLLLDSLIGEYDSVKYIVSTKVHILEDELRLKPFPELLKILDKYKQKLLEEE